MHIKFQHLDTQSTGDNITLFGRTQIGESVAVHINGFKPSFCIKIPDCDIDELKGKIKVALLRYKASKRIEKIKSKYDVNVTEFIAKHVDDVCRFKVHEGQDIIDFQEKGTPKFLEIFTKNKWDVYNLKEILTKQVDYVIKQDIHECGTVETWEKQTFMLKRPFTIYNDQVDKGLQYLIKQNIYSCSWMEINGDQVATRETTCDIELMTHVSDAEHKQITCNDMAPWRILTYDIEAVPHPRGNGKFNFPKAEDDPICTIGAILQINDDITKHVWIHSPNGDPFEELSPVKNPTDDYTSEDTVVHYFDDEFKMLVSFNDFIVMQDIDIIEGYNSSWFDHPYFFERYKTLNPESVYPLWGRFKYIRSTVKEKVFHSNQAGKNVTRTLYAPGRIDHDAYQVMKKNHNLNSYKLDDVAFEFLGTKKYPMDYNEIYPKYQTKEGRDELAVYCVKDAWLTRKLMHKLSKLYVSFQLACVTGIGINDVLNRGQGIRAMSLLLRRCRERTPAYFIPRRDTVYKSKKHTELCKNEQNLLDVNTVTEDVVEGYKGAVVLEPKPNFYKDAIATLDFASLYPTCMQSMNMSYETKVSRKTMLEMGWTEGKEVRTVPDYSFVGGRMKTQIDYNTNIIFATKETRQGIMPEILDALLSERRAVKKEMKKHHPDSVQYKIADGRQLGLKTCANSLYGFTGAQVGFLPDKDIAESVTKYGRGLTLKTQDLIENHPVWGIEHGVTCVYGDTDSVFCHLPRSLCDGKTPEETVARAEEIGKEMGEYVDSHFLKPINLEFEKIYLPFMLIKKKRYCGKKWEDGHVKIDIKGLECVRRDFCPLLVKTQKAMLSLLMETMDSVAACKIVSSAIEDLAMDRIPLELLTMSKKLSRSPDEYKVMGAHVNLAKRINKERGEQHGFVAGDRVPYVIAKGNSHKMSENAVLPEEITSGKFVVDLDYYRNKQMIPPLTRILEKICDNPTSLFAFLAIKKPKVTGMFSTWAKKRKALPIWKLEDRKVIKKGKQTTFNFF